MVGRTYERASDVLWRETLHGVLLLSRTADLPVTLTSCGIDLWLLLEQPQAEGDLARQLADIYGVEVDEVAQDIRLLLAQLQELDAVRVH